MKLLRLTSDNENGIIETNFNEDIKIDENSKIALMNASFSVSEERFTIDEFNHKISYFSSETGNDNETSIFLDKTDYIKENSNELLEDITNKFNDNLIENTRNIGAQIRCETEGGRTTFRTKISPNNGNLFKDFLTPSNALQTNMALNITNTNNLDMNSTQGAFNNDKAVVASFKEFGKGFSTIRTRIKKLETIVGNTSAGGFLIGLSEISPSEWTLSGDFYSDNEKTYYIRIADPSLPTHIYTKIKGASEVEVNLQLDKTGNNATPDANQLEIVKNGKNLDFRLYRASEASFDLLLRLPMADTNVKLYPFYILRGGAGSLSLDQCKYTLDPYRTNLSSYLNPIVDDSEYNGLGAVPKQINSSARTNKKVVFQSSILSNFLGFETNQLTNNNRYAGQFLNKANNSFKILIQNPYFIIKINNIDLESYDADSKGRFNILSTFGNDQENTTRSIFYEASNPIFLDMKNNTPRTLRNIRTQILNSDLSQTSTDGFSSITLLIQ